jgi:exopolysaccharide biosynthesis polyprenyl glycosylphosphotransferase
VRAGWLNERRVVWLLVLGDAVAVGIAYAAAFALRIALPIPLTASLLPAERLFALHDALPLAFVSQSSLLYLFGLYDPRHLRRGAGLVSGTLAALGIQLLSISAWYFFRGDLVFPRSVLLLFSATNCAIVVVARLVAHRLLGRGARPTRIVLVGPPSEVDELQAGLRETDPEARRFAVVGTVATGGSARQTGAGPERALRAPGALRRVCELASDAAVDQVILVGAESWKDELLDRILRDGGGAVRPRVAVVPSVYDILVGRLASLSIEDMPLIEVVKDPRDELVFTLKSALDYLLAALLFAVTLPVCLLAALAVGLTSPGPILYRQRRVGRGEREFLMYKLRTMCDGAEGETGPVLAQSNDARVTAVGRVLRATRIDEIPQLLNVLNGSMSLIGPRPERPEFAAEFARTIPGYVERWLVKPGLSGLAQVRGEYHTSPAHKLKYDLAYIYNYSLALDLKILVETLKAMATHRGV